MITVKKHEIIPEKKDVYFERLCRDLEMSVVFSTLRDKSEAGRSRSERGYQLIAATTSRQLARALGCSENIAGSLSMAVGSFFPKYGQQGIAAVKKYISANNIDLDPETLGVDMIEYSLYSGLNVISTDFDELLKEYFGGIEKTQEVCIVRFVQSAIIDIKKAEAFYDGDPGDLLFNVTSEMVASAKETGHLIRSKILEKFDERISTYSFPLLTESEQMDVDEALDRYIDSFSNYSEDMESLDRTPEEAVLIYMKMYD